MYELMLACAGGFDHSRAAVESQSSSELSSVLRLSGLPATADEETVTELFPGMMLEFLSEMMTNVWLFLLITA